MYVFSIYKWGEKLNEVLVINSEGCDEMFFLIMLSLIVRYLYY